MKNSMAKEKITRSSETTIEKCLLELVTRKGQKPLGGLVGIEGKEIKTVNANSFFKMLGWKEGVGKGI